jgi:arsenate reductase-like glutaredoxin family protein
MKSTRKFLPHTLARTALWAIAFALCNSPAQAQQVYRIVGPDGRVMFTDRAPDPSVSAQMVSTGAGPSAGTSNTAGLPFELQQVSRKYPVVLYTAGNCEVCNQARSLLTSRGIPFAEKTVNTPADIEAFQRLSGENSMPFATIGSQKLKGYNELEWSQFLSAAAYPEKSQLPASYKYAAAAPLVEPPKDLSPASAPPTNSSLPTPAPTVNNPANIRF